MNKASKTAFKIMKYFLNNNKKVIKDFRMNYIFLPDDYGKLRLFTHNEMVKMYQHISPQDAFHRQKISQVQKDIFKKETKGDHKKYLKLLKESQHFLAIDKKSAKSDYNTIKYIKSDIIPATKGNDLIVFNTNYDIYQPKHRCNIFNKATMPTLKGKLLDFLTEDTEIKSRIRWMLQNKLVSDYKFGKQINMTPSQITKYRNGSLNIGNMTIDNGEKIDNYYMNFVSNRLIGRDIILSASDINQMV